MSSSKGPNAKGDEFESWIVEQYAATNGFTALILLLTLGGDRSGRRAEAVLRDISQQAAIDRVVERAPHAHIRERSAIVE